MSHPAQESLRQLSGQGTGCWPHVSPAVGLLWVLAGWGDGSPNTQWNGPPEQQPGVWCSEHPKQSLLVEGLEKGLLSEFSPEVHFGQQSGPLHLGAPSFRH